MMEKTSMYRNYHAILSQVHEVEEEPMSKEAERAALTIANLTFERCGANSDASRWYSYERKFSKQRLLGQLMDDIMHARTKNCFPRKLVDFFPFSLALGKVREIISAALWL